MKHRIEQIFHTKDELIKEFEYLNIVERLDGNGERIDVEETVLISPSYHQVAEMCDDCYCVIFDNQAQAVAFNDELLKQDQSEVIGMWCSDGDLHEYEGKPEALKYTIEKYVEHIEGEELKQVMSVAGWNNRNIYKDEV